MPFATLVPIYGLSSNAFFLHERLSNYQVMGSLLVISGLVVTVVLARYLRGRVPIHQ